MEPSDDRGRITSINKNHSDTFIMDNIPEWKLIAARNIEKGIDAVVFDRSKGGLIQTTNVLSARSGIGLIHIIGHGNPCNGQMNNDAPPIAYLSCANDLDIPTENTIKVVADNIDFKLFELTKNNLSDYNTCPNYSAFSSISSGKEFGASGSCNSVLLSLQGLLTK